MLVRDFMTSLIVTADATTPVLQAAKLMAVEDVGSLIVTTGDVLVGLVTQKDIIAAQLLSEELYHSLSLQDIMSSPVVTVSPDADLGQVITLMHQTGKRHIPVIDDDTIIGIVTSTDILRVLATMKLIADGAPEV
ncbi:MAG: CBS domain-containing protein [Candidatus Thorarchaeota archaeon]|nr:MAG: CBS domain-containing protein [Candidatus Thorarchaeota archaeon]